MLFVGLHLAMLGTVSWHDVPTDDEELDDYSLPATFMERIHGRLGGDAGDAAADLELLRLGLRRPARLLAHPLRRGPLRPFLRRASARSTRRTTSRTSSLLLVGGLTLFWSFFDLDNVINALIVTRILEQFVGQIVGVMLLRRTQPERPRPYRMWLYPLPCLPGPGGLAVPVRGGGLAVHRRWGCPCCPSD